jgi:hypothetical protein
MQQDRLTEWYLRRGWPKTCRMITLNFIYFSTHFRELLHKIKEFDEEQIEQLKVTLRKAIDDTMICSLDKAHMTLRQRAIWDAARSVYPNADVLLEKILKDDAARGMKQGVSAEQALGQIIQSYLNEVNHRSLGFSSYEDRVWKKLVKISDRIVNELREKHRGAPPRGYRCSGEHFEEIHRRIDPTDRRIGNISVEKIEEYFGWCCDECRDEVPLDSLGEIVSDEPWAGAPIELPFYLQQGAEKMLKAAVRRLPKVKRDLIRVIFYATSKSNSESNLAELKEKFGAKEVDRLRDEALCELARTLTSWKSEKI